MRQLRPNVAEQALDNKRFQTRAVSYVAARGVRQFLDIGSGLPTSPVRRAAAEPLWLATHEAARAVVPDAMVAYVDSDPMAVLHSQALLGGGYREVVAVGEDMRDPQAILAHDAIRAAGFDPDAPACVMLACVLPPPMSSPVVLIPGAGGQGWGWHFPVELQRRVARERLGIEPEVVPGGHLAALSQPEALSAALARCLGEP